MNQVIKRAIVYQDSYQKLLSDKSKKDGGVFFTSEVGIIESVLGIIDFDDNIMDKKILEPAVGNGIFLLKIIEKVRKLYPNKAEIRFFIENCLYFVDIESEMIERAQKNIKELYKDFFGEEYKGGFNAFVYDFTEKVRTDITLFSEIKNLELENLLQKMDYVVGNPPYVTLYGRRDRKKSEIQRINYLQQYRQFPRNLKNGKINYVMLFLEHGLDFLKEGGKLGFVIDISFFETAYKHTRKFLLENSSIMEIENNISDFDGVASGQIIIKIKNNVSNDNIVSIRDFITKEEQKIEQKKWLNLIDECRFRLNSSDTSQEILAKVKNYFSQTLKDQFPKKSLRTCTMLLDMENKFVSVEGQEDRGCNYYKYYQGSKALYDKYCVPFYDKNFFYDKKLRDEINDKLQKELKIRGIKNKKRIGFGDFLVYDNPKVFIRQSAKEIVATYDEEVSAANNSLYVFSLKNGDKNTRDYLKFLCGYLNSSISTFYAQEMEIIRYRKGKQPQIKISDLYTMPVPNDAKLIQKISALVDEIYNGKDKELYNGKINQAINSYLRFSDNEVKFINNFVLSYLKS